MIVVVFECSQLILHSLVRVFLGLNAQSEARVSTHPVLHHFRVEVIEFRIGGSRGRCLVNYQPFPVFGILRAHNSEVFESLIFQHFLVRVQSAESFSDRNLGDYIVVTAHENPLGYAKQAFEGGQASGQVESTRLLLLLRFVLRQSIERF
jgi:hypothetical protein